MSVKDHFKKHKATYIVAGTATIVVGGLVAYIAFGRNGSVQIAKPIQALTYKSTQINQIYQLPQVSNLAKPVLDITDPKNPIPYLSQNRAAAALGVGKSVVSKHLNGQIPDVKGHILEWVEEVA